MGIQDIGVEGTELISQLPPYIPPRNPTVKVTKGPDSLKFKVYTPLLLKELPIEGGLLVWVSFLKMED